LSESASLLTVVDVFAERHWAKSRIRVGVRVSSGIRISPHCAISPAVNTGHGLSPGDGGDGGGGDGDGCGCGDKTPVVQPCLEPGSNRPVNFPFSEHFAGVSLVLNVQTTQPLVAEQASQQSAGVLMVEIALRSGAKPLDHVSFE
jgi:hypothetical protein